MEVTLLSRERARKEGRRDRRGGDSWRGNDRGTGKGPEDQGGTRMEMRC